MKISWWYNDGNIVKKVWQTDGQKDRRTDRQTDWTIHRAAWSQLKTRSNSRQRWVHIAFHRSVWWTTHTCYAPLTITFPNHYIAFHFLTSSCLLVQSNVSMQLTPIHYALPAIMLQISEASCPDRVTASVILMYLSMWYQRYEILTNHTLGYICIGLNHKSR